MMPYLIRLFYFPLIIILLFLTTSSATNSAYIELLKARNNITYTELDTSWFWKNQAKKINLPYTFHDSVSSVVLINQFMLSRVNSSDKYRFWFLGIDGRVEVIVNGNSLFRHPDFCNPFNVIVPEEYLYEDQKNTIELHISRTQDDYSGLSQHVRLFREKEYLSVFREIFIETLPQYYFDRFSYAYTAGTFSYSFQLNVNSGSDKKQRLEEKIYSPDGSIVFSRFEYIESIQKDVQRSIPLRNPLLWSTNNPSIYTIELRLITDTGNTYRQSYQAGLRTVSTIGRDIQINGEPLQIRGINYRESRSIHRLDNHFKSNITKDLVHIKALNFNTIRIPHSVPHPLFAQLCDSLGLLLFVENWIWRMPSHYYSIDHLLKLTKSIGDEVFNFYFTHPSLIAYGIGHEIHVNEPTVQKFILIVNEYFKQRFKFISYLSPLSPVDLPTTALTDMYLYNYYEGAALRALKRRRTQQVPLILGNVGFASSDSAGSRKQTDLWAYFLNQYDRQDMYNGYFVESYQDWPGLTLSRLSSQPDLGGTSYYRYGIIDRSGAPRPFSYEFKNSTNSGLVRLPSFSPINRTNFFSLCVFIASVIFFLIYKSNYRLRENLKRAITHPYGFFVDLRDRRIISIANSTLLSLFATLIVANIQAAYLYFYHNSLLLEEYASTLLTTNESKILYLNISESPVLSFSIFWIGSYTLQFFTAILIKLYNIFTKDKFRFRQAIAVSNWSSAPILFFLPISLLSLQILNVEAFRPLLLALVFSLIFWYHIRLINGIRILFMTRIIHVIVIVILTYAGLLSTFFVFFDVNYDLMSYWSLLTGAISLFPAL